MCAYRGMCGYQVEYSKYYCVSFSYISVPYMHTFCSQYNFVNSGKCGPAVECLTLHLKVVGLNPGGKGIGLHDFHNPHNDQEYSRADPGFQVRGGAQFLSIFGPFGIL